MYRRTELEAARKEDIETAYNEFKKNHAVVRIIDTETKRKPVGVEEFTVYRRLIICDCKSHEKVNYGKSHKMRALQI